MNRLGVQGDALQGVGYEEKGDIVSVEEVYLAFGWKYPFALTCVLQYFILLGR